MTQLRPGETRAPLAGIETVLDEAMSGRLSMQDFLVRFAEAPIIVVSAQDAAVDRGQLQPMLFSPNDVTVMAVFTARDRANAWSAEAPFSVTLTGLEVFEGLGEGIGLVVNPGSGLGFEMDPEGVPAIVAHLRAGRDTDRPGPNVRLEQAILDATTGDISPQQLLDTFSTSQVYVLSHTDDGLAPVIFLRDGEDGVVGVFTRPDFAQPYSADVPHALSVDAGWLAESLGDGMGIVVNPGSSQPWELSADIVSSLRSAHSGESAGESAGGGDPS
jgi:hypothetical protein